MSKDTIEVSLSAARSMIPCLEGQIAELENQIGGLGIELESRKNALAEIRARLSGKDAQLGDNGSKRLRKGEAEKIIVELLRNQPGLSIQEVVDRSGVPYSSTFRILNQNKKGYFDNPEGLWRLKTKK